MKIVQTAEFTDREEKFLGGKRKGSGKDVETGESLLANDPERPPQIKK